MQPVHVNPEAVTPVNPEPLPVNDDALTLPLALIFPLTSSFWAGDRVPTPTLPPTSAMSTLPNAAPEPLPPLPLAEPAPIAVPPAPPAMSGLPPVPAVTGPIPCPPAPPTILGLPPGPPPEPPPIPCPPGPPVAFNPGSPGPPGPPFPMPCAPPGPATCNCAFGAPVPIPTFPPERTSWLPPATKPFPGKLRAPVMVSPALST